MAVTRLNLALLFVLFLGAVGCSSTEPPVAVTQNEPSETESPPPASTETDKPSQLDFSQATALAAVEPTKLEMPLAEIKSKSSSVGCFFSPDGTRLYAVSTEQPLTIYDPQSFAEKESWNLEVPELSFLAWVYLCMSADGSAIAVLDKQNTIHVVDTATAKVRSSFAHKSDVMAVALSPDGSIAVLSDKGTDDEWFDKQTSKYVAWDTATGESKWTKETRWRDTKPVAFSPDRKTVALAGTFDFELCDAHTGNVQRSLPVKTIPSDAVYSPDGNQLLLATVDRSDDTRYLSLLTVSDLKPVWIIQSDLRFLNALEFTPSGESIVMLGSSGGDDRLDWLEAASGKRIAAYQGELKSPVSFSPDGKLMLTRMSIWEVEKLRK